MVQVQSPSGPARARQQPVASSRCINVPVASDAVEVGFIEPDVERRATRAAFLAIELGLGHGPMLRRDRSSSGRMTGMSRNIESARAPEPVGAYPHAKQVGNLLFLSGVGPRRRGTKEI